MSLPHAWPVDQVVTEATRGRDAVLEDVRRRPRHTWCSARSRGHAQSSPRYESSPPSRAPSARGHSKMASAAEVFPQLREPGKSFGKTDFHGARPPTCSVHHSNWSGERMDRRRVNVEKPMVLKNRQIFSTYASSRAATRQRNPAQRTVPGRGGGVPYLRRTVAAPTTVRTINHAINENTNCYDIR
jgi:hypothetical protein